MNKSTLKDVISLLILIAFGATWYFFSFSVALILAIIVVIIDVTYKDNGPVPALLTAGVAITIYSLLGMAALYWAMIVVGVISGLMAVAAAISLINPERGSGSVLTDGVGRSFCFDSVRYAALVRRKGAGLADVVRQGGQLFCPRAYAYSIKGSNP